MVRQWYLTERPAAIRGVMLGGLLKQVASRLLVARNEWTRRAFENCELAQQALKSGDLDKAEIFYRRAIQFDPESGVLAYNLGLLLHQVGEHDEAANLLERATLACPEMQAAHASYFSALEMAGNTARQRLCELHIAWAEKHADPMTPFQKAPATKRTPRNIGYLSADLRRHAVGRLVEPVIRAHNRDRYRVFCYANSSDSDDMTSHLQGMADEWRQTNKLSDEEFCELVKSDGIDILVDLSGHSSGNRLTALARRPAALQMTWMGYLNTTGMSAIDYRITDAESDPKGAERYYREALLRLPHAQWCYAAKAGPVCSPEILRAGMFQGTAIRLGCMTRFMKVTDDMVNIWIRVLLALPEAQLTLIDVPNHSRAGSLRRRFEDAGLSGRLRLLPTLAGIDYWNCISSIDLALDTFPYTGATTTLDCLWMGVPVLTMRGECGAERSATSILRTLGMDELTVSSADEYVDRLVRIANQPGHLENLSRDLRNRMLASPIGNPEKFTRNLEAAMEHAWAEKFGGGQESV